MKVKWRAASGGKQAIKEEESEDEDERVEIRMGGKGRTEW